MPAAADAPGEDLAHRRARGPGEVQRVEGGALGFGDRGRHREPRAHAARGRSRAAAAAPASTTAPSTCAGSAGTVMQPGAVATIRPPSPTSAARKPSACTWAASTTGPSARRRAGARGGPASPAAPTGPRVDPDQPERLQLGGDRARGRAGHPEFGGEHRAGRRAAGVHSASAGPSAPRPRSSLVRSLRSPPYSHFVPTLNKIGTAFRARTAPAAPPPTAPCRRLRIALTVFFALDGFVFAGWVVRIPAIKAPDRRLRGRPGPRPARRVGGRGGHDDAHRPALPPLRQPSGDGRQRRPALAEHRPAAADALGARPRPGAAGLRRRRTAGSTSP